MPTTLLITSVSLMLPLLPSGRPLPENHAGVDIAEAEARLDEHAQVGHRPKPPRNRRRERCDLGMHVLAVDRRVQEPALHHEHARDALDPARGAERVPDERLRGGDRREPAPRARSRRGPPPPPPPLSAPWGPLAREPPRPPLP